MNCLIIFSLVFYFINACYGLLILPYNNVPSTIAAGDKISVPISNDKFIISYCAALGNSFLYTENNERTEYSPIAFFKDSSTLELYVPEVTDASKKYFIVVELPLAEAIIKTEAFTITPGSKINLPTVDGCGKNVKFSNKDNNVDATSNNQNKNENNANDKEGNKNNENVPIGDSKANILSAESTSDSPEAQSNNMVIIACAGTSVVALVVISGLVFIRGKSYMKGDEDISYSSLNYMGSNGYSPKPFNPVGGLYDNLTNSNDEFDREYQLKCLNDVPSPASYPNSLSDGSCLNDRNTDVYEPEEEVPLPDLPITKHIVEETVINPEKVLSETINSNAVSAVVTTASVALAINECGDLTINNSNIAMGSESLMTPVTPVEKSTTTTNSCSTCSSSCTCSSCSSCSCSCSGSGTCSCSCNETSKYTSTNNSSSLKLLSLDFSTTMGADTTRGYSVFVDNDNKNSSVYTDTNYYDSRRLTNYTETTGYDDSRRLTNYTETTGYDDSRRLTNYTETTGYDDSRRNTNYTETTGYDDSRRNTNYTEYTEGTSYTTDSRRYTNYTEGSSYTNRDSRYSEYTEGSSYSSCSCSGSECDCSHRNSEYTSYTTDSRYTDSRYTDSRYTDSRYTDSRYTDSRYTDSRRLTYTDYSSSQYSSDFCEAHDATDSEPPSRILLSTIEPFGESNGSFIDVIQAKQKAIRDSIYSLLPTGPIEGKPPKLDLEFVAQSDYSASKAGELNVKTMDVLRIIENLDGGYYMVSNTTTGESGKIPAFAINSLL